MFAGKPIIGIAGGIGSGKSLVAALFGERGGLVLSADAFAKEAYRDPAIKRTLAQWWGDDAFNAAGEVDFKAVASRVFGDADARKRLEGLIHPWVGRRRDEEMARRAADPAVVAWIWDIPLLFEVGLDRRCDAVVFVDAPLTTRLERVKSGRGWDEKELARRENLQTPLDFKCQMAKYRVLNTADVGFARQQVDTILSDVLAHHATRSD